MTADRMTEAEARERLDRTARRTIRCISRSCGDAEVVEAILATTDALAVLLDPETMLRAWEKAGRVERYFDAQWCEKCQKNHGPTWRIVPDEEGATRE